MTDYMRGWEGEMASESQDPVKGRIILDESTNFEDWLLGFKF